MSYQIINNDVIEWAAEYDGPKFHAALLDPPYHLTSITKRFGKPNSAPAKGGVYKRSSAGFMGSDWDKVEDDGLGVAFRPETWAALTRHLYPGAFVLAFAGTRGYHRMAVAMEDSGLIIHPATGFLFLSGFPKATRIDTQVDKAAGVERQRNVTPNKRSRLHGDRPWMNDPDHMFLSKEPVSPLAKTWAGHRYGLQALKPAFEFIAVAQVPYQGRPVDSIVKTGAGALNIEQGRIKTSEDLGRVGKNNIGFMGQGTVGKGPSNYAGVPIENQGRWPANFLLQHTEFCTDSACVDQCPVAMLDRQSGERPAGGSRTGNEPSSLRGQAVNCYQDGLATSAFDSYGDSGPASRMFFKADWNYETAERLANADPIKYHPKPSTTEREAGLDSLPTKTRRRVNSGGLENEPRFAPTQVRNNHPTIKSISLNKYLATLLLPPDAYAPRRLLVPFCGVGSEMAGAILAGWEDVTGIEQSAAYCQIASKRLEFWSQWPGWGQTDVDTILSAIGDEDSRQGRLF